MNRVTYTLDLETSGLLSQGGRRSPLSPPRITQFALARDSHMMIGNPRQGLGFTDLILDIMERHNVQSDFKIPDSFYDEIIATNLYDPSVRTKGSVLNAQLKQHIRQILYSKGTGSIRSATTYIDAMMSSMERDINRGNTVKLLAYNRGFDIQQIFHELQASGQTDKAISIRDRLKGWQRQGQLRIVGGERLIHRSMFEKMLKDPSASPVFGSYDAFKNAALSGQKVVGLEASSRHHALVEMMKGVRDVAQGRDPNQVWDFIKNPEAKAILSKVRTFEDYERFEELLDTRPQLREDIMNSLRERVSEKHGVAMEQHVRIPSFRYSAGWKQELVAKVVERLGAKMPPGTAHSAPEDVLVTRVLDKLERQGLPEKGLSPDQLRAQIGDVLFSPEYQEDLINFQYQRWLHEPTNQRYVRDLPQETTRGARQLASSASRGRLPTSFLLLPALAVGGLLTYRLFSGENRPAPELDPVRRRMAAKLEGLRRPISQHQNTEAIQPNNPAAPGFSSGRDANKDRAWTEGYYRNVRIDPRIYQLEKNVGYTLEGPSVSANPNVLSLESMKSGRVDLSEYLAIARDGDTIDLYNRLAPDVPIIGGIVDYLQRAYLKFFNYPTTSIRVQGIDAPESPSTFSRGMPYHQESTDYLQDLLSDATHIDLEPGGTTHGRMVGTPFAGHRNISLEMVRAGAAISEASEINYRGPEYAAQSKGEGLWENPFYHGVARARAMGIAPTLSSMSRKGGLRDNPAAAASLSLSYQMIHGNFIRHGIQDSYTQNHNVMPRNMDTYSTIPTNRGALYR